MPAKKKPLRSQSWFGREDNNGFIYRSWVKNRGVPHDQFDGRPVIGICNTWSELTPCNTHFRVIAEHVKPRHAGGRRLPAGIPGDVARRDADAADGDAVPQPGVAWTWRNRSAPIRSTAWSCWWAATRPRPRC